MSLWGRFKGLHGFWQRILICHQEVTDEWSKALEFFGNEDALEAPDLIEKKKRYDQILQNPDLLGDTLDRLEENLKDLYEGMSNSRKEIRNNIESKKTFIKESLTKSADYRAYNCLSLFKGRSGLSASKLENAESYLEMHQAAETLRNKAKEKGVKLCGGERPGQRLWTLYKKLMNLVLDKTKGINEIVESGDIKIDQIRMMAEKGIIELQETVILRGFEACCEHDEDE